MNEKEFLVWFIHRCEEIVKAAIAAHVAAGVLYGKTKKQGWTKEQLEELALYAGLMDSFARRFHMKMVRARHMLGDILVEEYMKEHTNGGS